MYHQILLICIQMEFMVFDIQKSFFSFSYDARMDNTIFCSWFLQNIFYFWKVLDGFLILSSRDIYYSFFLLGIVRLRNIWYGFIIFYSNVHIFLVNINKFSDLFLNLIYYEHKRNLVYYHSLNMDKKLFYT